MIVKLEFKGALKSEFVVPAKDIRSALRWIDRNMPVSLEADRLEISNDKPEPIRRVK